MTVLDFAAAPPISRSPAYRSPMAIAQDFLGEAPVRLEEMAAALGLRVNMEADLPADISGRIRRKVLSGGVEEFEIEVNKAHSRRRRRFTLAHEIAHYLLHRDLMGTSVVDSEMYRSHLPDPIETEANAFAADLLMPAPLVRTAYRATKDIAGLAEAFDVSYEAMRVRLKQLRLAP